LLSLGGTYYFNGWGLKIRIANIRSTAASDTQPAFSHAPNKNTFFFLFLKEIKKLVVTVVALTV